jgi:hypothetical protein
MTSQQSTGSPAATPPGGSLVDRLARLAVATAARRWPADLAEIMQREWHAELDALQADPTLGRLATTWRTITFAGSLALSPAVEEAGSDPVTWSNRAAAIARPAAAAAGVTMLAAALFNAVHLIYHHTRLTGAGAAGVLAVAGLLMVGLAHASKRDHASSREHTRKAIQPTALLGAAMFGFLFAGNQVAVMPFMGWIDIVPAVATWTILTGLTVYATTRLIAAGRHRIAVLVAVAAGLITLDLTAVAGSVHAAGVLGTGLGSALTWFPLALLPGGPHGSGPAFDASPLLIGNASAMVGPLLLGTVYLLAHTIAPQGQRSKSRALDERVRIALAAGGALLTLALADLMQRSTATVDGTLHRMADNSNVFGFGFLAGLPGRIAVALLAGLLIAHAADSTRRATEHHAA